MKDKTVFLVAAIFLLVSSNAYAALNTIGTAKHQGNDYNLVWDDDNNGNSIVWMDYSNEALPGDTSDPDVSGWGRQVEWAESLNSPYLLTYTIYDGYTVSWAGDWRLPDVGANPGSGCDGAGQGSDQTTSEMGHLFFVELGINSITTHTNEELNAAGPFENLIARDHWYGNAFEADTDYAWAFDMCDGSQYAIDNDAWARGLAVREAEVSAVPMPAAVWLLGSGVIGLAGLRRKARV